ncbi:hypothetical protein GCM10010965_03430 [Caldalkalibacillus thermarum]|uniref:FliH/SctL family protein n=1 Tax=Caldalkalibacillus thermarum TaxID=296745 RepID=UPI00166C5D13|nr:FliH/SctL family protein [Caldalkalibacillus thermarum]GGK13757.1 hypothetical protein GCM10010965_03430 [Caldalkalibacillus thermarum]
MSNLLKSAYRAAEVRKLGSQGFSSRLQTKTQTGECHELGTTIQQLIQQKEILLEEIDQLKQEQEQLKREADDLKAETRREIEEWWKQKEKELEQLKEQAYREGYEQGFRQGQSSAEQRYKDKIEQAEHIINKAYAQRDEVLKSAEPDLLKLSVAIAQKVIGEELRQSPEAVKSFVRQGLQRVFERDELILHVPAEHYPAFLPHMDEWSACVEGQLKLIPDSTLTGQQCILHTPHGSYDLTIDKQLGEIKKQLLAFYGERMARDPEH